MSRSPGWSSGLVVNSEHYYLTPDVGAKGSNLGIVRTTAVLVRLLYLYEVSHLCVEDRVVRTYQVCIVDRGIF